MREAGVSEPVTSARRHRRSIERTAFSAAVTGTKTPEDMVVRRTALATTLYRF
jgi:hypothetical protein